MKNISLWVCLLFTFNVGAANYVVTEQWKLPTEREQCIEFDADGNCTAFDPLQLDEIDYHTMYRVNCDTKQKTGEIIYSNLQHNLTILFWSSSTPIDCFIFTTTDTEGRTSKDSEIFYGTEWNAPKPVECVP